MDKTYGAPLITLKTDFKSLKYPLVSETTGKTIGESPYVIKKIPDHTLKDGRLIVDPEPRSGTSQINARLDDTQRIGKLFLKRPGQKFAQNLALLKAGSPDGLKSLIDVPKIIASTLAQVPVSGTGTHFIYGFGGNEYLTDGQGPQTALGRFLTNNLGVGTKGVDGAKSALRGETIIPDNYGDEGYAPLTESNITDKNSRFDLKAGFNNETPYLRGDLKDVFTLVKGIFTKKKEDSKKGIPANLGSIFKANPLNLGQEGFRTEKEGDVTTQEDIQSQLKGPVKPDSYLSNNNLGELNGRAQIKGTPEDSNAKIVNDNDGGKGFTFQSFDSLVKKESTQTINSNGSDLPLRPVHTLQSENPGPYTRDTLPNWQGTNKDGFNQLEHNQIGKEQAETHVKVTNLSAGLSPNGPSTSGRLLGEVGPDAESTNTLITFKTPEGDTDTKTQSKYKPNTPSQLKMFLQDQSGIPEAEELKTELGGTVSSGNTNTKRTTKLIDFRKVRKWGANAGVRGLTESIGPDSNGYGSTTDISQIDYTQQNVEVRLKHAQKGLADYVNALDVYEVGNTDRLVQATQAYFDADIIPFEFNILTPTNQKFLYFRAFLDSLNDKYSGDWNGTQFIGRAEEFFTYQKFSRSVSFGFKIAAFSKEELVPLYRKLNHLVGSTAPSYSANGSFMRGTLCTLTIGEYLNRQDGFITSVDVSWDVAHPWEIDLYNENLPKVPTVLSVSINFTPIHNFNPKSNIDIDNKNETYIGANLTSGSSTPPPAPQPRPSVPPIELTQTLSPKVSNPIDTPKSSTINPTTSFNTNLKEVSREITVLTTIPTKYVAKIEYMNAATGQKGIGKSVNNVESRAINDATTKAMNNAV